MSKKQTAHEWLLAHISYEGDDCLKWPYSTVDGYGQFWIGRTSIHYAHRYLCEKVHGPAPSPKHHAAHDCGNGANGCVNPRHIRWKTPSENMYDRTAHGTATAGPVSKYSADTIRQVKALRGIKTQKEIGEMFGISRSNVGCIQRGKTWKHVTSVKS